MRPNPIRRGRDCIYVRSCAIVNSVGRFAVICAVVPRRQCVNPLFINRRDDPGRSDWYVQPYRPQRVAQLGRRSLFYSGPSTGCNLRVYDSASRGPIQLTAGQAPSLKGKECAVVGLVCTSEILPFPNSPSPPRDVLWRFRSVACRDSLKREWIDLVDQCLFCLN